MANLYELSAAWLQVYELTDEDISSEAWLDTLESLDESIEQKADNIAKLIRSLELDHAGYKKEADRFNQKATTADKKIKSLKAYLKQNMELTGKEKFKTDLFNFRLQNNPESVDVTDENKVPKNYIVTTSTSKVDKKMLLADLKAGVEVTGAELKQSRHLRFN